MKHIAKVAAVAAIVGASVLPAQSAHAWWGGPGGWGGGPWSGLTDMFGDVDANFSSRGWGRGHGYGYPYYGYGYPGWGGYPYGGWGGYPYGGWGGYPGWGGMPYYGVPAAPAASSEKK